MVMGVGGWSIEVWSAGIYVCTCSSDGDGGLLTWGGDSLLQRFHNSHLEECSLTFRDHILHVVIGLGIASYRDAIMECLF